MKYHLTLVRMTLMKEKKEREGERERGEGRRQKHLVHVYQQQSLGKTNIIKLFPLLRISKCPRGK